MLHNPRTIVCICLVAGLALCMGCGAKPEPASSAPPPQAQPASPPPPSSAASSGAVQARVEVVDLDGRPLEGITPIATTTSNAFDKPVVVGPPTDADGHSELSLPPDLRLYVRAWDPSLVYFANNYFDIPPGEATSTPLMQVVMVHGAALDVILLKPDKTPAANTNVGLMLFHPLKGPWWPGEADSDANGLVRFPALPAGKYTIKLKALDAGMIDLPDVTLPPGGETDLGVVVLQ